MVEWVSKSSVYLFIGYFTTRLSLSVTWKPLAIKNNSYSIVTNFNSDLYFSQLSLRISAAAPTGIVFNWNVETYNEENLTNFFHTCSAEARSILIIWETRLKALLTHVYSIAFFVLLVVWAWMTRYILVLLFSCKYIFW